MQSDQVLYYISPVLRLSPLNLVVIYFLWLVRFWLNTGSNRLSEHEPELQSYTYLLPWASHVRKLYHTR